MPRPALFEEAATETVRVRVTRTQKAAIRQAARENGMGVAGVIREAVNVFVSDYQAGDCVFRGPKQESVSDN